MSESEIPDASRENRGSPLPGCIILTAILTIFGGLIILYSVVGHYQNKTIGTFTEEASADLAIPQPDAAAVDAATGKLRAVAEAVAAGRSERILFSAVELNVLIASLEAAKDFRGNTRIKGIDERGIHAEMAQPLRKGIFEKGVRYLNGTFTLQPELRARTVAFKVVAIDPKTGAIPPGFVKNYQVLDLFKLDPKNPDIETNVPGLDAVYTEAGNLVVETKVGS